MTFVRGVALLANVVSVGLCGFLWLTEVGDEYWSSEDTLILIAFSIGSICSLSVVFATLLDPPKSDTLWSLFVEERKARLRRRIKKDLDPDESRSQGGSNG